MACRFRQFSWFAAVACISITLVLPGARAAEENAAAIEKRMGEAVQYLASDALEGRGIGTKGIDLAADYIAREFSALGLKTDMYEGTPFQKFMLTASVEQGPAEKNRLVLTGPAEKPGGEPRKVELKLGTTFTPLAIGGSGTIDAPLVFVGYGITAKDILQPHSKESYDEYAGLDVKGKVVVLLRKEPQQSDPHSPFNGAEPSVYAHFSQKITNAAEHGAAAVIMVNDAPELSKKLEADKKAWNSAVDQLAEDREKFKKLEKPMPEQIADHRKQMGQLGERIATLGKNLEGEYDLLLKFQEAGRDASGRQIPVFFCTRGVIDGVFKQAIGHDLATCEKEIDAKLAPQSCALEGWKAVGESDVVRKRVEAKNIIAVLEGEGPLAEETIVVGAHYDHLGYGEDGSLAPWTRDIHHGADDNASGVAALLEIARELAGREKKLPRRVVFIAFTGEERGLLGSAKYTKEPRFPLAKTVAMVNLDMVGRLKDEKLLVYGTGTAAELDNLVDSLNKSHGFKIVKKPEGFGPSDHSSFYAQKIPVLHLFTDTHSDYHRPSDTFDKVNVPGMRRVATYTADIVANLASMEKAPAYKATTQTFASRGGDRPYFGSIPDFGQEEPGYGITGVAPGSPAERGGLKGGDLIVQLGDVKVTSLDDFDRALRKYKGGDKVNVVVKRAKEELKLSVMLDPPK